MTDVASGLEARRSFTAEWTVRSAARDLRRWEEFLAAEGVPWSADDPTREQVEQTVRSTGSRARDLVEIRLEGAANAALKKAGDARRVLRLVSPGPQRHWYVLSPDERAELERAGHRFESSTSGSLRMLATIPIAIAVYIGTLYACRAVGLDEIYAWLGALAVYLITARLMRGRWPLQRPR